MIDSHAHLYDESFSKEINTIIQDIKNSGVKQVWLPNCDSSSWNDLWTLYINNPEFCRPMLGLHPTYVNESYLKELEFIEKELVENREKLLAIGEIGLDYYWDTSFINEQIESFEIQSSWALENHLWIDIHCRKAYSDLIRILSKPEFDQLLGVCHCFSGDFREAKKLVDLGYYLGIGGVITFKNTKLFESIKEIPIDYILLETDAPYLSPEPFRGKQNNPKYIPIIAHKLAELYHIPVEDLIEKTNENARKLIQYSAL